MTGLNRIASNRLTTRVTGNAYAVLLLTSVHHVYGAYAYNTPWRLHMVVISALTAAGIAGLLAVLRRHSNDRLGAIVFWAYVAVTLAIPVGPIGIYEGLYNHGAKNVLYFSGTPTDTMLRLFPPPTYELPNDLFFEVTGVLQIVPAIAAGYYLFRLLRRRLTGAEGRDARLPAERLEPL